MRFFLILSLLMMSACTDHHQGDILDLLDKRDASISQKDIQAYASLISDNYSKTNNTSPVQHMEKVFTVFEKVSMSSRDRNIQILDPEHAICEQTYILKVYADGEWRKIIQREQLKFHYENDAWKISAGL